MAAADRLAEFVAWVQASSRRRQTPMGGDWIEPGPYAVVVPTALDATPQSVAHGHLPLALPTTQVIPNLPPFDVAAPTGHGTVSDRARHLVFMAQDGIRDVAVLSLSEGETLQAALDRQAPSLDLAEVPALFLRLDLLAGDPRLPWFLGNLPVLRR